MLNVSVIEIASVDEPIVEINVDGIDLPCLIDTGMARLLLNVLDPKLPTSNQRVSLARVSNRVISAEVTKPVPVTLGEHSTTHYFVLSPYSPCSLLGRDLLSKMGVTIALSPGKTIIDIPHKVEEEALAFLGLVGYCRQFVFASILYYYWPFTGIIERTH